MEDSFNKIPNLPSEEKVADFPPIEIQWGSLEDEREDTLWIDFLSGDDAEGIKSAGEETYVISPITEQNLFSDKYLNCTGAVGIGRSKASGKEIAFISHQDPKYFIDKGPEYSEKFRKDLEETLRALMDQSETGSVEVVIFGGNIDPANAESEKTIEYRKSVDILNSIIRDVTGRDPAVMSEPNPDKGAIDVTVTTQTRKISIDR